MKSWQRLRRDKKYQANLKWRERLIVAIRDFFATRGYRETDVPLLAPALAAESYYEIFETRLLNRYRNQKPAYLTTSPELFLKKLLVAGVGNCYTITKSFRNTEDLSSTHNPEFTILEWYRLTRNYFDLMTETEELFLHIFRNLFSRKKPLLTYASQTIDLTQPWERLTMVNAFERFAKVDLNQALSLSGIKKVAQKKGYFTTSTTTWEELFHQIYLNEVEPHLGKTRPTIIYEFPSQIAALARKKPQDPRFAERFEVYIGGLELGDCYAELTDWREQEERFVHETRKRKHLGKIEHPYDKDFIAALKEGLPPCAGLALGVDRTVMLFCNATHIQDVLYFPAGDLWADT